jgi:hypothetical protein
MLCLLLLGEERKRKRKGEATVFFSPCPEAQQALLAVLGRISVAVKCS